MNTNKIVAKGAVSAPVPQPPVTAPSASLLAEQPPPAPAVITPETLPAEIGAHGRRGQSRPLFDPAIVRRAIVDSFKKLDPRHQIRNPVMFVVEVGSLLTTGLFVQSVVGQGEAPPGFIL